MQGADAAEGRQFLRTSKAERTLQKCTFIRNDKMGGAVLRSIFAFVLITVCAVLLFFCWKKSADAAWQYDSEGLVIGRMYQMQTGKNGGNPAGFLGGFDKAESQNHGAASAYDQVGLYFDNTPVAAQEYWTYTHQSGVQGTLWGVANRMLCLLGLSAQMRLNVLHFINVWLLCAAVFAVSVWAKQEWGVLPAFFCGAGMLISPWTLRACANLYWQLWLSVALFVLAAQLARACERKKSLSGLGLLCLFAVLLLRFLCGFEFASTVLVCVEVPFVFYFVKHCGGADGCFQWLRAALCVAFAGLSAFAAAMLVWFGQLSWHLGSASAAVSEMLVPIANRTGAVGTVQAGYDASLAMPIGEVMHLYVTSDTILPGLSVFALLCVYGVLLVTAILVAAKQKDKAALRAHIAMLAAVGAGALAAVSWFILARGHAAVHPHINYILWLLPFVPLCCAHIGVCVRTLCGCLDITINRGKGDAT